MSAEPIHPDDCDDETYLAGRAAKYGTAKPPDGMNPFTTGELPLGRREASRILRLSGSFLYAARMSSGVVKFGFTAGLLSSRIDQLAGDARDAGEQFDRLIAIHHGTKADERALHRSLAGHRSHGREWYNPTPEVMAVVNDWRAALGMDACS
jgi:hypothetical protein